VPLGPRRYFLLTNQELTWQGVLRKAPDPTNNKY